MVFHCGGAASRSHHYTCDWSIQGLWNLLYLLTYRSSLCNSDRQDRSRVTDFEASLRLRLRTQIEAQSGHSTHYDHAEIFTLTMFFARDICLETARYTVPKEIQSVSNSIHLHTSHCGNVTNPQKNGSCIGVCLLHI